MGMGSMAFLVPARNERDNLPRLLYALCAQRTDEMEIWVCDDESDDGTTEWLAQNAEPLGVRWFRSAPRPEGWVGKNWACHQLAHKPNSEWLVFLDADAVVQPGFVASLRSQLHRSTAQLVSGIPTLVPANLWVGLLKAMLPFSIFTLLPLYAAEQVAHPAFAFANGQLLAIRTQDYWRWRPHEQVRACVLEDVAIAEWIKRHGGCVSILDLRRVLHVCMYHNLSEAFRGLAKNATAICRTIPTALLVVLMLIMVYGTPLVALWASPSPLAIGGVLLSACIYGASARMAGLPFWYGMLYPIGISLGVAVLLYSLRWYLRGEVYWKGRAYRVR